MPQEPTIKRAKCGLYHDTETGKPIAHRCDERFSVRKQNPVEAPAPVSQRKSNPRRAIPRGESSREENPREDNPSCSCKAKAARISRLPNPTVGTPESRCSLLRARYIVNNDNPIDQIPSCEELEATDGPNLDRLVERAQMARHQWRQNNPIETPPPAPSRRMNPVEGPDPEPSAPSVKAREPVASPTPPAATRAPVRAPKATPSAPAAPAEPPASASSSAIIQTGRNVAWREKRITLLPGMKTVLAKMPADLSSYLGTLQSGASGKVSLSMIDGALIDLKNGTSQGHYRGQMKDFAEKLTTSLSALRQNWSAYASSGKAALDSRDYGIKNESRIKVLWVGRS